MGACGLFVVFENFKAHPYMTRHSSTIIVEEELIYTEGELKSLVISESYISEIFQFDRTSNVFLVKARIFKNKAICSRCPKRSTLDV